MLGAGEVQRNTFSIFMETILPDMLESPPDIHA
jgi:hypothetical protein